MAPRHSAIVRLTHWVVVVSVAGLFASGAGILISHPRLYWGETGNVGTASLIDLPIPFVIGPSVWNRPFHFFFAWILVLAGLAYLAGGLITRHFRRNLLGAASNYTRLQRLTYVAVVFILSPAILWTGLAMSFGVTSVVPFLASVLGGHQSARTLHFASAVVLLLFAVGHVAMVYLDGFWSNVRAMITGYAEPHVSARPRVAVPRRRFISAGLTTAASLSGLGAAVYAADRYRLIPPKHTGIGGIGETLTYASQRLLTSRYSMAREFSRGEISASSPVNGPHPEDEPYLALLADGFRNWRLSVEGLVGRPLSLSLEELQGLPAESRILLHACEEGWSYIAEWTGVRLATVLERADIRPEARYVVFEPFPNPNQSRRVVRALWDSIDMADALHPQTLLAYGMNGEAVPADHGAPVRLRLGRHLGYKNTKYLSRIVVTDRRDLYRQSRGTWYGGI
jgi:DMSO/TMAO reductase YedYZ molybdopterin-dependent catalytic subunit/thiosulfate reductase cytochrome b subunit